MDSIMLGDGMLRVRWKRWYWDDASVGRWENSSPRLRSPFPTDAMDAAGGDYSDRLKVAAAEYTKAEKVRVAVMKWEVVGVVKAEDR